MQTPVFIPRPDPLTVLVPAWGVSWGVVGGLMAFLAPEDVSAAIPKWGVLGFFIGLFVTSASVLLSLRPKHVRAVTWNIRGWLALGSVCLTYSGWAAIAFQWVGFWASSLLFTIAMASFWQARRLNVALSRPEE